VVDLARFPGPTSRGELVVGHVVLGCDYGKQILARVRDVFGGEIRSFRRVLDRGRREALLRMQQQADALGSDLVVNVRFTTAMMGSRLLAAEVICYGTAVVR
ncbi:MAG: YbjQ family protein, partial [Actinomycetota bacterium]|nr:YbjQ family protein [Actinomycetota bacterium]